ncbi:cytochrome c oxidase assembly factor CtaG [Calidifontibacillus oryziterrae]|uniref:cytochrome c oxidase assembly factor CtaG n=1 Tax=Calidifontibacillus oryziterrae TaxID=1191699 RepID=UPI0002FE3BAF|nr:cytochrome c oxidase assembly factor CtaG [Calidifontibacillus oryziterrae]
MLEKLSVFGVRAMWSPIFLLIIVLIGLFYIWVVNNRKSRKLQPVSSKQQLLFISALLILYIIKGSPLDLLGHLNFSVHMFQMSILYLVVPPLLLMGFPTRMFEYALDNKVIEKVIVIVTKPLFSVVLFNGLFSFYHFPFIFDQVKTNPFLHAVVTVVLFISAMIMWWPILTPIKKYSTLGGLQKLAYIFAMGVLLTPACALIIFAEQPLFKTYTDPMVWAKALELCVPNGMLSAIDLSSPQLFSWLPAKDDQRLGGVLMKIIQELVYGIALGYVFFQWVKSEKERDQQESLSVVTPYLLK